MGISKKQRKEYFKKKIAAGLQLAHTCNPSFFGGRDEED
jgi:hypothetical protein